MKKLGLLLFVMAVGAFTAFTTTYKQVKTLGPYYNTTEKYSASLGGQAGGEVRIFLNGVDTLIVGDVVYISANNTVRKSATLANYNKVAGVVVGGTKTNMSGATSAPAATDTAATAGQQVLVLTTGRAWVRVDTVAVGIPAGTLIQPSIYVAGKVMAKAASIDSLNRVIGRMIDSGGLSTQALAHINVK